MREMRIDIKGVKGLYDLIIELEGNLNALNKTLEKFEELNVHAELTSVNGKDEFKVKEKELDEISANVINKIYIAVMNALREKKIVR